MMALVEGWYLHCYQELLCCHKWLLFEKSENVGYGPFLQIWSHIVMATLPQLPYTYQQGGRVGGHPLLVLVVCSQICPASFKGPDLLYVASRRVRSSKEMSQSDSFTLLNDQDIPAAMVYTRIML